MPLRRKWEWAPKTDPQGMLTGQLVRLPESSKSEMKVFQVFPSSNPG